MSQAAALVAQLAAAGTPPELLGAVAEALFAGEIGMKAIEERREADRQRKAAQRSREVTGQDVTGTDPFLDKKSPHTPSKIKPIQAPPFIPPILEAWNAMAKPHKLTQIQSIAGKRRRAVAARVAEHGVDGVLKAISAVPKSPHWLGENGWMGNFDSLMRPEHCQRMIELADASDPALDPEQVRANKVGLAELYDKMGRTNEADEIRRSLAA